MEIKEAKPPPPKGKEKPAETTTKPTGIGDVKPKKKAGRPTVADRLKDQIEDMVNSIALAVSMTGDQHCATILAQGAPGLAEAWTDLAKQNPGVKKVLEAMVSGSAWSQALFTTFGIAIPIMQHHNLMPNTFWGGKSEKEDSGTAPTAD